MNKLRKFMDGDSSLFGPIGFRRMELMRNAARTRRCHTQMVIHHQSVGEHTFGALAILDLIAPDCRKEVWIALLYHDAPEAITGDVPAPAKWRFTTLENALKVAERTIAKEHGIHVDLLGDEAALVKFADLMELVWYGIEEMRMGNGGVGQMVHAALNAIYTRELVKDNNRAYQFLEFSVATYESLGGTTDDF